MEKQRLRPKILIVDDIAENLIALQMLLRKIDVEVLQAQSGKDGLDILAKHDVNLILLDVMMPEMNGYQVAEFVRDNDRTAHIPIIFVTAMDKNEVSESLGYTKGGIDFLFKPINEIVLMSKIKVHLELQEKRQLIKYDFDTNNAKSPKILIVDDNEENLVSLEQILGTLDTTIVKASSGNEALSATLYNEFALIILDDVMPGMDGYEVAEILKFDERTASIPIIFITALNADNKEELKGYKQGAVDFITKPFNGFILLSKVKIFLELYKIKSALEHLVAERNQELNQANLYLSEHNKRLNDIVTSISKFSNKDSLAATGNLILEEFASHMKAKGGSLYLVTDDGLDILHALDLSHPKKHIPFPLPEGSFIQRVIDNRKPIVVDDINSLNNVRSSGWKGYTSDSIIAFPILGRNETCDKTLAVLILHNKTTPPFTNHDLEIGNILISYVSETLRGTQYKEALIRSERQYRALFERANDAFFLVDRSSKLIVDANLVALEMTGLSSAALKAKTLDELVSRGTRSFTKEMKTLEHATDLGQYIITQYTGATRDVLISAVPLDEQCAIFIAKDITERIESEKKLQQVRKLESLGTMAGGIAHDFNNLLSPILGYSDLLIKGHGSEKSKEIALQEIYTAATRAKSLVKQILTFSHQGKNEFETVDIEPVVREVVEQLRSTISDNIEFDINLPTGPSLVNGDSTLLHQVAMNLAKNGCQAMGDKGGTLSVGLNIVDTELTPLLNNNLPSGVYFEFAVCDTGTGIKSSILENIFDPFFTTKQSKDGTGMGLSVVHGVVKRLGGQIEVVSEPCFGSCFSVYIPKLEEEDVEETSDIKQEGEHICERYIMVVDDEKPILTLTSKMLEIAGYKVVSFMDPLEALEEFNQNSDEYSLILTDFNMPQMAGDKLAKEVRKVSKTIPIVILTGFRGKISPEIQNYLNIADVIEKPAGFDDFITRIGEAISNSSN